MNDTKKIAAQAIEDGLTIEDCRDLIDALELVIDSAGTAGFEPTSLLDAYGDLNELYAAMSEQVSA